MPDEAVPPSEADDPTAPLPLDLRTESQEPDTSRPLLPTTTSSR